ncbi:MAG: hypothetical protein CVU79_04310, partial [Elusimicrobia bacterium HGW-Elusimicrobia-3]
MARRTAAAALLLLWSAVTGTGAGGGGRGDAFSFALSRGNCKLSAGLDAAKGGAVKKKDADYNPDIELAKGATLTASSYDKTQGVDVTLTRVTVGGRAGEVEFTGEATGKGPGIEGTMNVWLSIFRFMRPDGTVNHVSGWNIALALKPGQTALETAQAF